MPEDTLSFVSDVVEDSGDYGRAFIGTVEAKARIATKLANRIKDLGYDVSFTPAV